MTTTRGVRCLLSLLMAGVLQACVSVFPASEPAQLYRFGDAAAPPAGPHTTQTPVNVFLAGMAFDRAAAGDRILTVTGTQTAYIKGARWVTSAQDLFDAALQRAFDQGGGPARLVQSGSLAHSGFHLALNVYAFEVRYPQETGSAPDILVSLRATLADSKTRSLVGERDFNATLKADENRVGSFVNAFDRGVGQVLDELVGWVNMQGTARGAGEKPE